MEINIGLNENDREGISEVLNKVLSDEIMLYQKLRHFHWNVKGMDFRSLHLMFEEQYKEIEEIIDEVAERIASMGHGAKGSLASIKENSRIVEKAENFPKPMNMVSELRTDQEKMVEFLRKDLKDCGEKYNDAGSEDLLTGIMQKHLKMAWMLRATISQ
jgi:starvation-inducible DNA-binding protein